MNKESNKHQLVGYGTYVLTWLGLLVLTAATVTVAGMRLGNFSVFTAIVIASIKSTIVLMFFMHLKYESRVFKIMLLVVVVVLAIFIGFTFFDISFR